MNDIGKLAVIWENVSKRVRQVHVVIVFRGILRENVSIFGVIIH